MGVEAVISTQVIDTTTVGRSLMTAADSAAARTAIGAGTSSFDGAYGSLSGVPSTFTPSSHAHGNITNAGAIGSTASLPIITGASGILQAGSFGSTAGTFCQGNDSRLSDARTPTAHTHTTAEITGFGEAVDDEVATLLVAGTNISITYNDAANTLTIANTAAGLSGTGSVDNAALRADGTGGATLQNSAWIINDNLTTSPNNTVNHACLEATGGTTNVSVSIKPKGSGAFCLAAPDGTVTGGNARGANAIDLQTLRSAATQVASGAGSVALGRYATASGAAAFAAGDNLEGTGSLASGVRGSVAFAGGQATGREAVAIGYNCTASGANTSLAIGNGSTASGNFSATAIGNNVTASGNITQAFGNGAVADRYGMFARAAATFASVGDAQQVAFVLRNKTTNNTATTLFLDGSSTRLTIPSGKVASLMCRICGIKSDGSAVANYVRRVVIKNVGGTTSLVGAVETIGTDIEDNASTDVTITADNTNDALQIDVTGITSETWRWVAVVEGLEIAYGT